MSKKQAFLFIVFVIAFISTTYATDRLVPSQYATIQAGIDAAVNGDTVIIADGTYTGTGNYNIDFAGKAITVRSENGPENCIIDCQNTSGRRGFYFHSGETNSSVISGLTIKRGNMGGDPAMGGGIYCSNSSPTIENCFIINNIAAGDTGLCSLFGTDGKYGYGGGIYCGSNSHPILSNSSIISNSARGGLGGCDDDPERPTGCEGRNGGWAYGGGIYSSGDSSLTINNCTLDNNLALGGNGRTCSNSDGIGGSKGGRNLLFPNRYIYNKQ